MDNIRGYIYDKSEGHNSPNGVWFKAERDGKTYFLKKFQQPKYPKEGINKALFESKRDECADWLAQKKKLIGALDELGNGTGNIISPRDVFREKLCYYQATYWVDVRTDSLSTVKKYSEPNKIMLLRTYAAALKKVHSKGIIHGDLKPDNVLIGKSASNKPVAKLIDFDDSYFSGQALPPDMTVVTDAFQSPELAAYKQGHTEYRERLTCASDVFASGIIFHQFWCGEMPDYDGKATGGFLYEAIAAGKGYKLDDSLPKWLKRLIEDMLLPYPEDRPTMEDVHLRVSGPSEASAPEIPDVDYSLLDKVLCAVPKDMSAYTDSSVAACRKEIDEALNIREKGNQGEADDCARRLLAALKGLCKKEEISQLPTDYSKIDRVIGVIPPDLSRFTAESSDRLMKIFRIVCNNRKLRLQSDVDKLTAALFAAYKALEPCAVDYSIEVSHPLSAEYIAARIVSEDKVFVYTQTGSRLTIPKPTALSMGIVCKK